MPKIIFRQDAIDDLYDIWDYTYEEWSENQADKYYLELKFDCLHIGENPNLGIEYDGISKNLLGYKSGKHIIFYQKIELDQIEIIRILHERMDLKNKIEK